MNNSNARDMNRLAELLADEASAALDAPDVPELDGLLDSNPGIRRDEIMTAAALTQVALLRQAQRSGNRFVPVARMPAELRQRLASQGAAAARRRVQPASARTAPPTMPPSPVRPVTAYLGWALAATLAVALVVVRPDAPTAPDAVTARASLLNDATDVITLPWTPPTAAGYTGVTGDVVWSRSRQQGYLRLANMPVNDPARVQYQLWIVAPERDSKHPVDGGVFDVSSTGEVIVPIRAKLPVGAPKAFAITAEQPGGVVVSAGPLLVVAAR